MRMAMRMMWLVVAEGLACAGAGNTWWSNFVDGDTVKSIKKKAHETMDDFAAKLSSGNSRKHGKRGKGNSRKHGKGGKGDGASQSGPGGQSEKQEQATSATTEAERLKAELRDAKLAASQCEEKLRGGVEYKATWRRCAISLAGQRASLGDAAGVHEELEARLVQSEVARALLQRHINEADAAADLERLGFDDAVDAAGDEFEHRLFHAREACVAEWEGRLRDAWLQANRSAAVAAAECDARVRAAATAAADDAKGSFCTLAPSLASGRVREPSNTKLKHVEGHPEEISRKEETAPAPQPSCAGVPGAARWGPSALREQHWTWVAAAVILLNFLELAAYFVFSSAKRLWMHRGARLEACGSQQAEFACHIEKTPSERGTLRCVRIACPGVYHRDVRADIVSNGCVVTIKRQASPGFGDVVWTRRFEFPETDGVHELMRDQASLEHGVLRLVFRALTPEQRAFQFPAHFDMDASDLDFAWTLADKDSDLDNLGGGRLLAPPADGPELVSAEEAAPDDELAESAGHVGADNTNAGSPTGSDKAQASAAAGYAASEEALAEGSGVTSSIPKSDNGEKHVPEIAGSFDAAGDVFGIGGRAAPEEADAEVHGLAGSVREWSGGAHGDLDVGEMDGLRRGEEGSGVGEAGAEGDEPEGDDVDLDEAAGNGLQEQFEGLAGAEAAVGGDEAAKEAAGSDDNASVASSASQDAGAEFEFIQW